LLLILDLKVYFGQNFRQLLP